MKTPILSAIPVVLVAAGVFFAPAMASMAFAANETPKQEPAGRTPSTEPPEDNSSLPESLEKAKKRIGDGLEKTGEVVRETLGITKQGCLKRGDESDPYLLEETESGEVITVVGSPELAAHLDHTVRLHGREESEGRVFHATSVEQIASSCDPLTDQPLKPAQPGNRVTAEDQGTNATDRKITHEIRQALVRDETLSILARNAKIITQNGFVTLKGPVRSEVEKQNVEAKAVAVAGKGNVRNELTVEAGRPGATNPEN